MLDMESLKYYKIIGKVHTRIDQAVTIDEALKEGLKIILENCAADYAVIWYQDKKGDSQIHPYYWICPVDLTSAAYQEGEGIVGQTIEKKEAVIIPDYEKSDRRETFPDAEKLAITSLVCVPFDSGIDTSGCIEFFKSGGSGAAAFTEEEADMCQLLTLMAEVAIKETTFAQDDWKTGEVILSARNITREFKNGDTVTKVLNGVNLDVFDGEFLVLLGESGCGKSTFLNIIGGMDQPGGGTLHFMGEDLSHATQEQLTAYRRDNIGFIFQSYNLMPNLNAIQNLNLIGELVEEPMDSEEALKLVGLSERKHNYPSQMSGGQQQRVSIARALIKKPKLILADEPTAALDYKTSIEVLSTLEQVIAQGTTLVMVTHNEEITKMADRVVRFRGGMTYEITVNHHPCKAVDLVW